MTGYIITNNEGWFFRCEYNESTNETSFYRSDRPSIFKFLDECKEVQQGLAEQGHKVKILKLTLENLEEDENNA